MEELLLSAPKALKISDIFQDYYIGESAIANDEKQIAKKIKKFDLELVRKNRTLAISGTETSIRRGIAEGIWRMNILDIDEIKTSQELQFNRYDVHFVSEQLKLIEKKIGAGIPYPYNVNVFSHLYILISRSRKTNYQIKEIELSLEQRQTLNRGSQVYEIAKTVIQNIERYLITKLPTSEVYYLYQYLISSRMEKAIQKVPTFPDKVAEITSYYLKEVAEKINLKITSEAIFIDLANHIKPMLHRLKNHIHVKNGLLEQIQLTYEEIYRHVSDVSKKISEVHQLPPINSDENGFITLYFARMLETQQLPIQTLIMCTTGIGTSELLRAKVNKNFPKLTIVDVIATKNYHCALKKNPGIELILTTIGIKDKLPARTLLVSGMLMADDQTRIQRKIEEIYNER